MNGRFGLKNITRKERHMNDEDPLKQVYLDAAMAALLVWGYGETLTGDELTRAAANWAGNPGHRAAIESAYRAGQAGDDRG